MFQYLQLIWLSKLEETTPGNFSRPCLHHPAVMCFLFITPAEEMY